MATFVLRRLLWTLPVLFVATTLLFGLMRAIGGDPLRHDEAGISNAGWVKYADPKPEAIRRNMERRLGLDDPWYVAYGRFLRSVATLDFGNTFWWRARTVNSIIKEQGLISAELAALALAWTLALGVPLGLLAALRAGSLVDGGIRLASGIGLSLPNFLVATLLIYFLALRWNVFPTSGWDDWRSKVLPSFTLGLMPAAVLARLLRGSILEVVAHPYVGAATAKGLRRRRIVSAHVLRNALVPVVTLLGPIVGYFVSGAFVVEIVFAVPGISKFFVAAVLARDYPLILGVTFTLTVLIVVVNGVVDIAHAALDPRIRDAGALEGAAR